MIWRYFRKASNLLKKRFGKLEHAQKLRRRGDSDRLRAFAGDARKPDGGGHARELIVGEALFFELTLKMLPLARRTDKADKAEREAQSALEHRYVLGVIVGQDEQVRPRW